MSLKRQYILRRMESLRMRLESLESLRQLVALPAGFDLSDEQWSVLNTHLAMSKAKMLSKMKKGARELMPGIADPRVARTLNSLLGEIEMDMARAFILFDTYADILTQRHSPELGKALVGCDILALDAVRRPHPALSIIEPPVVSCERGFGASTLRENISFPDRTPNPLPLIQIPYSRMKEKHNLTSILHEAGHEAIVRLGLIRALPRALSLALKRAGTPEDIVRLYSLWTSEIGPDLWTFCLSGLAQPATIREILALPPGHVFRVSWTDPHPPPYIRLLLSVEWCRQVWGKGIWDDWEKDWRELYPLEDASKSEQNILRDAERYIPLVARILLGTRFQVLEGKPITSLFDLSALNPTRLQRSADTAASGKLDLKGLSPCSQLTVFRLIREKGDTSEERLDEMMSLWLSKLKAKRNKIK